MEEARRFLRYVIPGLVFIIEVSFYLFISDNKKFVDLIKEYGKDIALPISVFLASGGIGFLLGVIYFAIYKLKIVRPFVVNHLPLIKDAEKRGWLKLQMRTDGGQVDVNDVTELGAWRIITSLWHVRKESSKKIKAANSMTDRLGDIMHGLGASFIGSIIAILIFILFILNYQKFSCWYFYFVPFLMSFFHFLNYRYSVRDFQSLVDIIMADVLQEECSKNKKPIIINVVPRDLK